jgi:hypothetical protein
MRGPVWIRLLSARLFGLTLFRGPTVFRTE